MSEPFSYDDVPYPSYTFPKTFPDRLATMAALHGIEAADPASCRVLELGCGDGTNLLAMAYTTPGSKFTGIDLSQFHIEKARRSAEWIGTKNVDFTQADVTEIDPNELGEFDYIVAHGLFSWVPELVRGSILDIYSKCLARIGVGYISYNVFPGGHIRRMVWDMMRFHTTDEQDPTAKVQKAREIAAFVADAAGPDTPYKAVLEQEVKKITSRDDQGLFHDDLSTLNRPFYFYEFVELLKLNGLRYFADADPEQAIERNLSDERRRLLNDLTNRDKVRHEQFVDFIRGQRFRRSLFCRGDVRPLDDISVDAIDGLLLTTRLEQAKISSDGAAKFVGPDDQTIELKHPLTRAILNYLKNEWPRAVPFLEALDAVSPPDITDKDIATSRRYLMDLFDVELVDLHRFQAPFLREVSTKPEASRFARLQVELGCGVVTTVPGANIEMSIQALRVLISLLDGKQGRAELIDAMSERIGVPEAEEQTLREQLPQMIESNLQEMCELGLLVG